jgi:hypothetical protein
MPLNRIECLVDAIARLNAAFNPESEIYRLRNPLGIKSFARPGKHNTDEQGRRIFTSFLSGYKACVYDIDLKLRGQSRAGLKPTDHLENLLGVYNIHHKVGIDHVVSFLRRALDDQTISKNTPLSYFLENSPETGQEV